MPCQTSKVCWLLPNADAYKQGGKSIAPKVIWAIDQWYAVALVYTTTAATSDLLNNVQAGCVVKAYVHFSDDFWLFGFSQERPL